LAEVLGGATEADIEEAPLTMAADDEQVSFQVGHDLYHDVARIADAENFRYLYPFDRKLAP